MRMHVEAYGSQEDGARARALLRPGNGSLTDDTNRLRVESGRKEGECRKVSKCH